MTECQYLDLDLDASLKKLSEWLAMRRANEHSFTENSRRHRGLSERLRALAAVLDDDEWFYLEEAYDQDPPPTVGLNGMPIPYSGNNAMRYKILRSQLRELAETADRMADGNPKPRSKPELPLAGDFFLHLWLAAGFDRPSLYDDGPAVTSFKSVLDDAKYVLTAQRVRGILSEALDRFDPHYCLDQWQLDRLMVWRQ